MEKSGCSGSGVGGEREREREVCPSTKYPLTRMFSRPVCAADWQRQLRKNAPANFSFRHFVDNDKRVERGSHDMIKAHPIIP